MRMSSKAASRPFPILLLLLAIGVRQGEPVRLLTEEAETTGLIYSACRQAKYFDLCVSTFLSRPESSNADAKALLLISLDACIAHAEGTLAYGQQLLSNATAAVSASDDDYAAQCLDDCLTQYSDALDNLRESAADAQNGAYGSVNTKVSGAMTDSDSCEDGFSDRPGYNSPLTERNNYFAKLCSNALAMAGLQS